MKKTLTLIFSISLLPYLASAQLEYGAGIGMSVNGTPSDNMYYQADKYIPNYAANFVVMENFGKDKSWQAGVDVHVLQLANRSSKRYLSTLPAYYEPTPLIGNDGTKFVFSQFTVSATAIANKKFPVGNGEMYLGVAFGYASARNFSGTGSPVVSYMAPDGGQGPVYGGQIGYTLNSSKETSFNIELAPRYYSFSFDAHAPYPNNHAPLLKFNDIAYPITIGFRYKMPDKSKIYSKIHMDHFLNYDQLEIGIAGGVSMNNTPTGNVYYFGDQMIPNYAAAITIAENIGDAKWQLGLEGHVFEMASTSTQAYKGEDYPVIIGGDGKKIVYSRVTTTICAIGNRKFYYGRNELYLGLAVGLGIARTSHNIMPDEGYVAPDGGRGMVFGGQIGYTYNVSPRFGLNIEAAPRYLCMAYDAMAPYYVRPHNNLYYNIWAYPVTFGLRFKINNANKEDVPRFDMDKFQRKRENWRS